MNNICSSNGSPGFYSWALHSTPTREEAKPESEIFDGVFDRYPQNEHFTQSEHALIGAESEAGRYTESESESIHVQAHTGLEGENIQLDPRAMSDGIPVADDLETRIAWAKEKIRHDLNNWDECFGKFIQARPPLISSSGKNPSDNNLVIKTLTYRKSENSELLKEIETRFQQRSEYGDNVSFDRADLAIDSDEESSSGAFGARRDSKDFDRKELEYARFDFREYQWSKLKNSYLPNLHRQEDLLQKKRHNVCGLRLDLQDHVQAALIGVNTRSSMPKRSNWSKDEKLEHVYQLNLLIGGKERRVGLTAYAKEHGIDPEQLKGWMRSYPVVGNWPGRQIELGTREKLIAEFNELLDEDPKASMEAFASKKGIARSTFAYWYSKDILELLRNAEDVEPEERDALVKQFLTEKQADPTLTKAAFALDRGINPDTFRHWFDKPSLLKRMQDGVGAMFGGMKR